MSGREHTALWLVCLGTCLVRGGGTAKVTASTKVYDDISCGGEMRSVVKKKKKVFFIFSASGVSSPAVAFQGSRG
jgi:hypothetical protein